MFKNVTVIPKANAYFGGKVVSHTIQFENGSKKTVGIIYPGTYTFNTQAAERMEIIHGTCQVKVAGQASSSPYTAGQEFQVPANSSFEIKVDQEWAEYICSFE
jgi:uncharacterized protein YaiE (UPF0345 family)